MKMAAAARGEFFGEAEPGLAEATGNHPRDCEEKSVDKTCRIPNDDIPRHGATDDGRTTIW